MIEIPGTSTAVQELNFKCYDEYEVADLYMSRLVVEPFISRSLETKLQIRFGHVDDYDDAPGQVLFNDDFGYLQRFCR